MGCFSPFPHGTGSLSVRNEYLALRDGPRGFKQGFSCPALLRYLLRVWSTFAYASVTLYGSPFQRIRAIAQIGNSTVAGPTTPDAPKCNGFGLFRFRSPLLSESRFLSSPGGTEMVHFPPFAHAHLCIQWDVPGFAQVGFPIRKSPDQRLCAAPRSLSQLATSFIACFCQGIHRAPLVA